jgi:NAD(P)-dependent dehydrogenase (short-subunit alcohol dehydrogenase family)
MQMNNKTVLITGANSGAGFAAARKIAALGAEVVMICRDSERGNAAMKEVAKAATGPAPTLLLADLASQAAIRDVAAEVRSRFQRLDVLLNNAGAIFGQRELSVDGIEKTFAINHLAPFLLTNLLLDLVQAAPQGRIITVSSESHSRAIDFDNLQSERSYNFFAAYNRSKLGNLLFTYELARRLKGTATTANSLSPGPTKTRFGNNLQGLPALFPRVMKSIPFLFVSPEKSAGTYVYVACSPELSGISGRFFLRSREKRTAKISYGVEAATRLWQISEELCAQRTTSSEGIRPRNEMGNHQAPAIIRS